MRPVAEYLLQTDDPATIIAIFEADSAAPIMGMRVDWGDDFDITVAPAVMVDKGLGLAQQMMQDSS